MKHRLLCLLALVVVLASIGANLIQVPSVDAATAGDKYCTGKYSTQGTNIQDYNACKAGYDGGKSGKTLSVSCAKYGSSDQQGSTGRICKLAWDASKATSTGPVQPYKNPSDAAKKACTDGNAGAQNACERGFDGGKNGKTEDQACAILVGESQTLGTREECTAGWDIATGKPVPGSGTRDTGNGNNGSGNSDANKQLGCDAQFTNPLTWIICPVVDVLVGIVEAIDNMITDQLNIKTDAIFCTNSDTCGAYYSAWQSFRNIALGLMAIAGLVIVIAQALGTEILDAYTIRKTLPRLLIAAVAITISWPLMKFLVQLSDDLGFGVRSLIYAPFAHLSGTLDLSFGSGIADVFFGGLTTAAATVAIPTAVILAGGIGGLLAYAATAALAVFVAIVVLTLRQIAIILLMLLSPIAIVAYILPNTQRVYRLWWESFSKALLMFPLIAAFIATGRVFSAIAIHNGGALNQLIGFIAYFAPYFLIPLTFRMAGGVMSGMGNFVNSRAQGGFEGLRKTRAGLRQRNREKLATGKGLNEDVTTLGYNRFAKRYNDLTRGAANVRNAGYNPGKWRQRMSAAESTRSSGAGLEALEKNEYARDLKVDNDLVETALTFDTDNEVEAELIKRSLTPERAKQGTAMIRAFRHSVDRPTFDKAMLIAAAGTSSGAEPKRDSDGKLLQSSINGGGGLRAKINEKLGDDRNGAVAVLGAVRQQAESKGRLDLVGGSFTQDAEMLEKQYKGGADGTKLSVEEWTNQIHRNALDGQSRARILSGHQRALANLAPLMGKELNEEVAGVNQNGEHDPSWTPEKAIEQYAFMAGAVDYAGNSAPEMARHVRNQLAQNVKVENLNADFAEELHKTGFKLTDNNGVRTDITHGEIMRHLQANDVRFSNYRREYQRGSEAEDWRRRIPPEEGG